MHFTYSDLGNVLLKFCEKREYAESILNGDIFMKGLGYFRQLEDTFRGDRYDGVVHVQEEYGTVSVAMGSETREMQIMTDDIYGMPNDDRMPVFCAILLDEVIMDPVSASLGCFLREISKRNTTIRQVCRSDTDSGIG